MEVVDIPLAPDHDPAALAERIVRAADMASLLIGAHTTLRNYSGSTHWHFKRPGGERRSGADLLARGRPPVVRRPHQPARRLGRRGDRADPRRNRVKRKT
jgi:hypothetical protein